MVEPWFVFWRDVVETKYPWRDQMSLRCRRSVWRKLPLGVYRSQIRPSARFRSHTRSVTWDIRTADTASYWVIGNFCTVVIGSALCSKTSHKSLKFGELFLTRSLLQNNVSRPCRFEFRLIEHIDSLRDDDDDDDNDKNNDNI